MAEPTSETIDANAEDRARAAAAAAAEETRLKEIEVKNARLAAEEATQRRLDAAKAAIQKKADEEARAAKADPKSVSASSLQPIVHDAPIVQKAIHDYETDQLFTLEEARKALLPEVRENLTKSANMQIFERTLARKDAQLADQFTSLMQLAAVALQKSKSMESVASDDKNAVQATMGSRGGRAPSSLAVASSSLGADAAGKAEGKGDAVDPKDVKKLAEALSKIKKVKGSSLSEKLRAQLGALKGTDKTADAGAKGGAEGTEAFSGKLSGAGGGAGAEGNSSIKESSSIASEAVSSALHSSDSKFTLAGAETDKAVKELQAGGPGKGVDGSIQDMESVSLFERVRIAHVNCLKRQCVAFN